MKRRSTLPLKSASKEIGRFIEYWGFKRIHGEVWTHLYLSSEPLSAAFLTKELGVSKALISLCIKDLLKYKLLLPAKNPDKKTKLFVANPDVFEVIRHVLRTREQVMLKKIAKTASELTSSHSRTKLTPRLSEERIHSLIEMIQMAELLLEQIIPLEPSEAMELAKSLSRDH